MKIINGHLAQSIVEQGLLQAPNPYGYVHLAAEIERPRPFRRSSASRKALLSALKDDAASLVAAEPEQVRRADVFDAVVIPPGSGEGRRYLREHGGQVHVARFDVVVLVECTSPSAAGAVRETPAFQRLRARLEAAASFVHCVTAANKKRIAEVDKTRPGVFLFNYFSVADLPPEATSRDEVLLAVWEYTAGWWTAKANLTNSTPLSPIEGERSQYDLINHCRWARWRDIVPHLLLRPSLGKFVLGNFTANGIVAMPILYRLA